MTGDDDGRKDYWLKHGKREDASLLLQVELNKSESDDLELEDGENSNGDSEDVEEYLDALEDETGGLSPGLRPGGAGAAARKRRNSKESTALTEVAATLARMQSEMTEMKSATLAAPVAAPAAPAPLAVLQRPAWWPAAWPFWAVKTDWLWRGALVLALWFVSRRRPRQVPVPPAVGVP